MIGKAFACSDYPGPVKALAKAYFSSQSAAASSASVVPCFDPPGWEISRMKIVALKQYIAAFGLAFIACITVLSSRAKASEAFVLPAPYAGAVCTFGLEKYGAIGLSLPGVDIPGLNGTEVKQIYRVFYKTELNGKDRVPGSGV